MLADKFEVILRESENKITALDFYGHDFGIERLGYIIVPYLLRRKIRDVKNKRLNLENGPYPPRKDGGYGWFIVEETVDESENCAEYNSGCNITMDDSNPSTQVYNYWIQKYYDNSIYHNNGIFWLCKTDAVKNNERGKISKNSFIQEDAARFVKNNLIKLTDGDYYLNIPYFTEVQFGKFASLFDMTDEKIDELLAEWIMSVRKNFESFVPNHLHGQINQWVYCYLDQIIGYVTDELIRRGILRKPDSEKPLTDGVFVLLGNMLLGNKYILNF